MIEKAQEWIHNGKEVALATVIATRGSSSRPTGSLLLIDEDGRFEGSVSGGCIEGEVIQEALGVIRRGSPRRLLFGAAQSQAWEVGPACGGQIEIFVEKVTWHAELNRLAEYRAALRPACLATDLENGSKHLMALDKAEPSDGQFLKIRQLLHGVGKGERSIVVKTDGRELFLHCFYPPAELVVIGAVHIAQSLCRFARTAGYKVCIIDPRSAFAKPERFPHVPIHLQWPDEAMAQMPLYHRTAVVSLCHDPKIDDPALMAALGSKAFYIGVLGSRRTHEERLERLRQAGFHADELSRIHGPVGLDIGAVTPEEIAISIMGEITAVRRSRSENGWQ